MGNLGKTTVSHAFNRIYESKPMLDRCVLSCCLALLAWTSFAIHWHVSTFCIYERWGAIERPANATSSCSNRGAWGQC